MAAGRRGEARTMRTAASANVVASASRAGREPTRPTRTPPAANPTTWMVCWLMLKTVEASR
jgi:hypothetical protein